MARDANVVGLEIVVPRISTAIEFFTQVVEWDLVHRGPAAHAPGEVAVFDAGSIALTLFEPAVDATDAIADASPRVSQLVIGGTTATVDDLMRRVTEAGIPLRTAAGGSFIPPASVVGILGAELALTLRPTDDVVDSAG